ncbi:quinone oxidoreductase [Oxalobacteraceae bacterium CAVE-383]|nr:quinone oxidoreductase [Oxalobacteraceae bacterium CAVE-383]
MNQTTQHQVRIYEYGAPSVMRYEAIPEAVGEPGAGQVRLRHQAIGLNFVDTLLRSGAMKMPLPFGMGVEGAGVVEAVGAGVAHLKAGDRAAYFFSFGAYANVRLVDAKVLVKLPEDIPASVAAALMAKGLTAWVLLKQAHPVRPGEIVLVHGAAGGVGSLLASWAKSLGAIVIATVGSPSKAAGVRARGIDHVLESGDPELAAKIQAIAGGRGVDVVYELIGKATFRQSVQALRDGGDLIHPGSASGAPDEADKAPLAARGIRYAQPITGQYIGDHATLETASADLFAAWRAGVFGAIEPVRYSLADVVRAHEDIAARRIVGSAILLPEGVA